MPSHLNLPPKEPVIPRCACNKFTEFTSQNRWKINIFSIPKKYSIRTCARHSLPSMEHRWWPKMEREYKEPREKKSSACDRGHPLRSTHSNAVICQSPPPHGWEFLTFLWKMKGCRPSPFWGIVFDVCRILDGTFPSFAERVKGFWGEWRFLQIILAAVDCDIQSGCENNQLFEYPVLAWLSLKQKNAPAAHCHLCRRRRWCAVSYI